MPFRNASQRLADPVQLPLQDNVPKLELALRANPDIDAVGDGGKLALVHRNGGDRETGTRGDSERILVPLLLPQSFGSSGRGRRNLAKAVRMGDQFLAALLGKCKASCE